MRKILIVDDDWIVVEVPKGMFEEEYEVACAHSGQEALRLALEFKPDLIVLDAVMTDLDGWKVCRRLKSNPETSSIKIIMISAHAMLPEHQQAARVAGADDFVLKSAGQSELLLRVRKLMD